MYCFEKASNNEFRKKYLALNSNTNLLISLLLALITHDATMSVNSSIVVIIIECCCLLHIYKHSHILIRQSDFVCQMNAMQQLVQSSSFVSGKMAVL